MLVKTISPGYLLVAVGSLAHVIWFRVSGKANVMSYSSLFQNV